MFTGSKAGTWRATQTWGKKTRDKCWLDRPVTRQMCGSSLRAGQKGGARLRGNQEARQNCGAAQNEALDAGDVEGGALMDRQESNQAGGSQPGAGVSRTAHGEPKEEVGLLGSLDFVAL